MLEKLKGWIERVKVWCRRSLTVLWARLLVLAGAILAAIDILIADPEFQASVRVILQPEYVPLYLGALGLITELVRRRTARKV